MDRAKQLFFNNNGIKHWMWHDGNLDEYNSFHISKKQESIWYEELQILRINELKNRADPDIIFRQLEAISAEINNHSYIEKAVEVLKNKNDSKKGL